MTTRRRLPPEQRRAELLDHTAKILVEQGSDALTIEAVAKAAGVNRALLYYYFDSRDNLLVELFDRTAERFDRALDTGLAGATSANERILAMVDAWVQDLDDRAAIIAAFQGARTESGELERRRAERAAHNASKLADIFAEQHGIEPSDAFIAAAALIGSAQALAVLRRATGMPTERIAAAFALFAVGGLDHLAAVTSDTGPDADTSTRSSDDESTQPDIVIIPEPAGESASST
jgi:AcrR family transcriptional regulator